MAGAVIVGVGPGLGGAIARRFAAEGLPVTLIARRLDAVRALAGEIDGVETLALRADSTDESSLHEALDASLGRFGVPEVAVYNAAVIRPDEPGELSAAELTQTWAVNVLGAYSLASFLLPGMADQGGGTYLITSGMPEPVAAYTSLSLGKAGVRSLAALLAQHHGPSGIHVATVTVAGAIASGTAYDPDLIAEHYVRLHRQPPGQWELDVLHTD